MLGNNGGWDVTAVLSRTCGPELIEFFFFFLLREKLFSRVRSVKAEGEKSPGVTSQ